MNDISIPIKDTNFSDVVYRQADKFISQHLTYVGMVVELTNSLSIDANLRYLKSALKNYKGTDRITFITRILIHLNDVQEKNISCSDDSDINELVRELQHFLVRDLESQKVGIGKVPFSKEEVMDLTYKVNKIVDVLNKIQTGQEVIFDRVEELKDDYKELLTSFALGKKPFLQRFTGITAAYIAEKGADEVYKKIEPIISKIFDNSLRLIQ